MSEMNTDDDAPTLRECPCCGESAVYNTIAAGDKIQYSVRCTGCGIQTARRARKSNAAELWNNRIDGNALLQDLSADVRALTQAVLGLQEDRPR